MEARSRRDIECLASYRNLPAETDYLHANFSWKGPCGNTATQICVHTDASLHPMAPIIWVPVDKHVPRCVRFGFPGIGKHGAYLDVNCEDGIGILCNVTIPHGSSSFDVEWHNEQDLCGIELSMETGARRDDRKPHDEITPSKRIALTSTFEPEITLSILNVITTPLEVCSMPMRNE